MAWLYLALAILFEVTGTVAMKLANGFSEPGPSLAIFVCYGASIGMLAMAIQRIDLGVAYATWAAIGTALVATVGIIWFRESVSLWKMLSLGLIIVGVVGLHVSGRSAPGS